MKSKLEIGEIVWDAKMKTIKMSEWYNAGLLSAYYVLSAVAIATLILYFAMYLVSPTKQIGISLASVFCMIGLIFTGWIIRKHWNKEEKNEYVTDRFLWLGISCGFLYGCLQTLDTKYIANDEGMKPLEE